MKYWLMKSEPSVYAWAQLVKDKRTGWSGVRNYQANNNMKAMEIGDQAFFYHSNEERSIVGVMKVVGLWHLDPEDETGKFGMVDVAPIKAMPQPVSLAVIKAHPSLAQMAFVRQGRLSVSSVTAAEWREIFKLAGLN